MQHLSDVYREKVTRACETGTVKYSFHAALLNTKQIVTLQQANDLETKSCSTEELTNHWMHFHSLFFLDLLIGSQDNTYSK